MAKFDTYEVDSGRESEWNEGKLKSIRLHEIQELINFYKMNLLSKTNGTFNFVLWRKSIDLLYGEGQSKYSSEERTEITELFKKVDEMVDDGVFVRKSFNSIGGRKSYSHLNDEKFKLLHEKLYELEMKIKDYNDKHGLTTRNRDDDLSGL